MNRIQHLLSPPAPPRFRWGLPAGILLLLGSGALVLAQANRTVPAQPPAKAAGSPAPLNLSPGSSCVVSDDSDGVLRVYRQRRSLLGKLSETYTENGQSRPIDPAVRQWVERQVRLGAEAGARAEAEARRAEAEAGRSEDARLQSLLGSPIAIEGEVRGSMSTWGPGDANSFFGLLPAGSKTELRIPLAGPKGRATLHATGRLREATWSFSRLEVVPAQGHRVNLLGAHQ